MDAFDESVDSSLSEKLLGLQQLREAGQDIPKGPLCCLRLLFAPDPRRKNQQSKALDMLKEMIANEALTKTIDAKLDPPEPGQPENSTNCHNIAIALMHDLCIYPSAAAPRSRFAARGWKWIVAKTDYVHPFDNRKWSHSWLECGHYAIDASGIIWVDGVDRRTSILIVDKWIYRSKLRDNVGEFEIFRELDQMGFVDWLFSGRASMPD